MKEMINKYYFGAWHNIYHINWPIRFFIELTILIFVGFCLLKFIRWIGKKLGIKSFLVKALVWAVTKIIYLAGHDSEWTIEADNKMIDWGIVEINGDKKKRSVIWKRVICLGVLAVYFLAVFVDLPVAKNLSGYYLEEFEDAKAFFQKYEIMISKDYEKYPPLFVKVEKEEPEEEVEAVGEDREPVYIRLNERGKRGSNIRSETDLNNSNNIIGGVNEKSEILYRGGCTYDGERYWIRVYIPTDDVEGWLSGNLIESKQLDEIISESIYLSGSN